ncbi:MULTISPECIES: hypothetical protein [Porphyromonas]|nr:MULTISPECIES: hypothetical protein [Porphyromonas]
MEKQRDRYPNYRQSVQALSPIVVSSGLSLFLTHSRPVGSGYILAICGRE